MKRITHQEMRDHSGEVLRLVAGEASVQVTNHGQVAAVVVPPDTNPLTELASRGQVRVARRPPSSLRSITRRRAGKSSEEIVDDLRGRS